MNRYVGQTEENMNRALLQAEGMAPCVLWIDEFEKMFASAGNDQSSHEVTQRINAAFLKWMEEKSEAVFVVATSNDLSNIKAEYTRTGRWDSTFFFDLPSLHERYQILKLNLDNYAGKGGHDVSEEEIGTSHKSNGPVPMLHNSQKTQKCVRLNPSGLTYQRNPPLPWNTSGMCWTNG